MGYPLLAALTFLSACTHQSTPSTPPPPTAAPTALASTIANLDSGMFSAFNAHDASAPGTWFTSASLCGEWFL